MKPYEGSMEDDSQGPRCRATFILANGELVTPCHKPKLHKDAHEGTCLGSLCHWPQGFSSEEELNTAQPDFSAALEKAWLNRKYMLVRKEDFILGFRAGWDARGGNNGK
jgi:hypothetical protein